MRWTSQSLPLSGVRRLQGKHDLEDADEAVRLGSHLPFAETVASRGRQSQGWMAADPGGGTVTLAVVPRARPSRSCL